MSTTKLEGEYSVCQWFPNGQYEYVRRFVGAEEALLAFRHYISSVGAKLGTTTEVRLTDGGDCTNMEWIREKGITYPPQYNGQYRNGVAPMLSKREKERMYPKDTSKTEDGDSNAS